MEDIRGWLLFGDDVRPFHDASVEIVLEDTTYADARAAPLSRVVLRGVSYDGGTGGSIPFTLRRPRRKEGRSETLRVLIDIDGDGRLGVGDYRNAESVPIPSGPVTELEVRVRRVE